MNRAAAALAALLLCGWVHAGHGPQRHEWLPGHDPAEGGAKTTLGGLPRSTADRPDEAQGPQVHAIYVVPSDGLDEQLDTDGRIGTSVAAFNRWLAQNTWGRAFRLDTFQGLPDITFFRLSSSDAQVRALGAYVRDELERQLRAAGRIRPDKLYAVYYGGSSTWSCGGGAWPPALPGQVGAMYLRGEPPGAIPCSTNRLGASLENPGYLEFGMLHELVHTLGLVATCAPNHTLQGHASDNRNDLMYAGNEPWLLPPRLDIGRNDYYGHGRGDCADLASSPYLTQADGANFTNLWWNPAEPGWGLNLNHQGDILFATLFTYASDESDLWLVASSLSRQPDGRFTGPLYRTRGPAFNASPWSPVSVLEVGSMTLAFESTRHGSLRYTVNGVTVSKAIENQVFAAARPQCASTTGSRAAATNYQDLWWNPAESGWGLNLTHQAGIIFATLFTYYPDGRDMWLVASDLRAGADGAWSGPLYRTRGPSHASSLWFPPTVTPVGTMRLAFAGGESGTLTYTVSGVTVTKAIQRQVFAARPPLCAF